jgi:hypothetical protein
MYPFPPIGPRSDPGPYFCFKPPVFQGRRSRGWRHSSRGPSITYASSPIWEAFFIPNGTPIHVVGFVLEQPTDVACDDVTFPGNEIAVEILFRKGKAS